MDEEKRARKGDTSPAGSPRKSPRLGRPAAATGAGSGGGGAAPQEGGNPCDELNDPNAASLDVMDEEKRARPADAEEATPLDVSDWWEKAAALTLLGFSGAGGARRCRHVLCDHDEVDLAITLIKTCYGTPKCGAPKCGNSEGKEIAVCLDCESRFCTRHGKRHAWNSQHWVALVYDRPNMAYCFACEECYFIRTDGFGEEMSVEDDELFLIGIHKKGEKGMTVDNEAGGLASMVTVPVAGGGIKTELDVSNLWKQVAALVSDGSIHCCPHVFCKEDDIDVAITMIKSCDEAPRCDSYMCDTTEKRNIMVCLGCESRFCIKHAYSHSWREQKEHWIALVYERPNVVYCFACEKCYFIRTDNFGEQMAVNDGEDAVVIDIHKEGEKGMTVDKEAGGHASGSVIRRACPIKGIPNRGNTCYVNALVQCLLVLERLRAAMLGPDAPKGIIGNTLRYLFEDADNVNNTGLLDPTQLLACLRMLNSGFVGTSMQDSHEVLCCLRDGLDREESIMKPSNIQDGAPSAVDPSVINSTFGSQISITRSCKRCSFRSVSCDVFHDLSVPLPSKTFSVESPPWTNKGHRSQRKIRINLFPAIEKQKRDNEKTCKIAERGDSQSPASELEDVVMVKESEPLKVDSSQVEQISQSKDAVKVVDVHPQEVLYDVKVEIADATAAESCIPEDLAPPLPPLVSLVREDNARIETGSDVDKNDIVVQPEVSTEEVTTEYKGKTKWDVIYDKAQDINSLASIEECLKLHFEAEMIEWACGNCSKVGEQNEQSEKISCQSEQSSNLNRLEVERTSSSSEFHGSDSQHQAMLTVDSITKGISGKQDLASDDIDDKKSECHEGVQEGTPSCAPADQNVSTQDEDKGKQVKLDHSAQQVEENQNDQKDKNDGAIQTCLIRKLSPVLVIHLIRSLLGPHKVIGHVRFKEILDMGLFMDPSSEDKANSSYRLVGVVEHLGQGNDAGHFVAYVRPSHPEQTSGSSSWFRASDENIREISLEEVLKCEAYLLFYERMED
ncbi:ubiquitin carboxyl-terminal hydrolase 1-like [Oryza brachyantha]|uniref:ubiquitin carboxyl-terminal hydrolase 1-like n=1 Tax=Oryza brachyantha TaxID=4533 RepID=UPI00077698A1|nr:ubiquitin carboxyl-terminal hydrolase 1-like [Oryza brachyantha]